MWRRLIAGAAALAILGMLGVTPGMHLHAAGDARPVADHHHAGDAGLPLLHSHATSHHAHPGDTDPASGERSPATGGDDVIALSTFQPRAQPVAAPAPPALIETVPVAVPPAVTAHLIDLPHPRAHDPPAHDRRPSRAPPVPASSAA